jgi:catecholate siderophore receptor
VTFGMGTPTEVTLSWQHLQTDNTPDGGVPYLYSNAAMAGLPGGTVRPTYGNDRANWYGLNNRDYEKEKSDLFTASVTHKFTDTNKIRNSLRYSKTKQDYVWTQPDDSKGNVLNGYVWRRGNARVSDTTTLQNVTEFTGKEQTGSIGHSYAFGLELSKEKPMAAPPPSRAAAPAHRCPTLVHHAEQPQRRQCPWNFAWDWCAIHRQQDRHHCGVRLRHSEAQRAMAGECRSARGPLQAQRIRPRARAATPAPAYDLSRSDTLFNYQLGLVYKPAANGSIYANIGTSRAPAARPWATAAKIWPPPPMRWPT